MDAVKDCGYLSAPLSIDNDNTATLRAASQLEHHTVLIRCIEDLMDDPEKGKSNFEKISGSAQINVNIFLFFLRSQPIDKPVQPLQRDFQIFNGVSVRDTKKAFPAIAKCRTGYDSNLFLL